VFHPPNHRFGIGSEYIHGLHFCRMFNQAIAGNAAGADK
jgi:hypothetical protein